VRRAISSSVVDLLRSDAVVRIDEDPEGVHQARVATRRLRSDLRTFGPLLEEGWTLALREELRWLGDALGDARDADVLLERLRRRSVRLPPDVAPGAEQVVRALQRYDREVHAVLMDVYRSDRYVALLDRLVAAANEPALAPEADPAAEDLPGLVRRPWRRLARDVGRAGKHPTEEQLHAIRIRTKRVRYAAEAVAPVAGKKARRFARAAERLQGILGEHNDAIVAEAWLRGWAAGAGSRDAAFAAGVLAGIERAAAADARGPWRRAWRTLKGQDPTGW
jgi:CHAD domain-containing protein